MWLPSDTYITSCTSYCLHPLNPFLLACPPPLLRDTPSSNVAAISNVSHCCCCRFRPPDHFNMFIRYEQAIHTTHLCALMLHTLAQWRTDTPMSTFTRHTLKFPTNSHLPPYPTCHIISHWLRSFSDTKKNGSMIPIRGGLYKRDTSKFNWTDKLLRI